MELGALCITDWSYHRCESSLLYSKSSIKQAMIGLLPFQLTSSSFLTESQSFRCTFSFPSLFYFSACVHAWVSKCAHMQECSITYCCNLFRHPQSNDCTRTSNYRPRWCKSHSGDTYSEFCFCTHRYLRKHQPQMACILNWAFTWCSWLPHANDNRQKKNKAKQGEAMHTENKHEI